MIKELIKLANHLDSKGLTKEADVLDAGAAFIRAHALLNRALIEYEKVVDTPWVDIYAGDDEGLASSVASAVKMAYTQNMRSNVDALLQVAKTNEGPDGNFRDGASPFEVIMAGLTTNHVAGLKSDGAKALWDSFTEAHNSWLSMVN